MLIKLKSFGLTNALFFAACFALAMFAIKVFGKYLPSDRGRALAVDGDKSKGKITSTGLIFVSAFVLISNLVFVMSLEIRLYTLGLLFAMLSGYLDDNAKKPWSEGKKGLIDAFIACFIALVFVVYNEKGLGINLFELYFVMPLWISFVFIAGLVFVMINVTNITDGVDGLSSTLSITTLLAFAAQNTILEVKDDLGALLLGFSAMLMAYLWYNSSPSTHLMGDAGSRAMGLMIAIAAIKSASPLMVVPFAVMIILDGGSSLFKLTMRRVFKWRKCMEGIRTPLHDHFRKNLGYSDTKTVNRFLIIQLVVIVFMLAYLGDYFI